MENLCLLSAQQFCSRQPTYLGQQTIIHIFFLSGMDVNLTDFFFFKWKPSARLTAWKSCKSHSLLSNLLGTGHQEQVIEGCWLHDHMSLVSFKRAFKNVRVHPLMFMLMFIFFSFSQSMSNKNYPKLLIEVLQGYAYCRCPKGSCVLMLLDVGELFSPR